MDTQQSEIRTKIDRMRAQADFLAKHEDLLSQLTHEAAMQRFFKQHGRSPKYGDGDEENEWEQLTYVSIMDGWNLDFTVNGPGSKVTMRDLRRAFGGQWKKETTSYSFALKQTINGIYVRIVSNREDVCQPKVVGKEKKVIPAVEAREAQPEREELVDKIEWDCGLVLDEESTAA